MSEVFVVGSPTNRTNVQLVAGWRAHGLLATLLPAAAAERVVRDEDVVLGRLDVLPTLDGVERGLLALLRIERRGIVVLNRAQSLVAVHDKLQTATALARAGLPHPTTTGWRGDGRPPVSPPVVLKPRFGSWGRDVVLCRDDVELASAVDQLRGRSWFRRHGALLQAAVPPAGHDLRVLVAAGEVVGAARRIAAPGEWRTNVALGGTLRPTAPDPEARSLAVGAARAVGADLVGVDLLPVDGGYVVLELNGAVDFDARYTLDGGDLHVAIATALELPLPQGRGVASSPGRDAARQYTNQ
jgi:RimK family alpha-L-glutamate ligase